jgi:zinc D-Ala-D-Ala carboxypeptidase
VRRPENKRHQKSAAKQATPSETHMNLSRFFTLDEMTFSNTAKAAGIDNTPTTAEIESLRALCTAVLDPLREALGSSIKVNSGYRGPALNARLKGAAKSQHLIGQAADIQAPGMSVVDLFKKVIRLGLPYDQIIYEVNGSSKWVHVSHAPGANKGVIMLGKFDAAGRVTYPRLTAEQALALPGEPVTRSGGAPALPGYIEGADEPDGGVSKASAPVARKAPAVTAVKKAPVRKAVSKQPAVKKPAAKKPAAKKSPAKKVVAKKVAAKKTVAKKAAVKKTAAKKAVVKKAVAKKAAAKKPSARMAPVKKPARKAAR